MKRTLHTLKRSLHSVVIAVGSGARPLALEEVSQPVYVRPRELESALEALASRPLTVLAGGTDFYPARVGRLICEDILDITGLAGLRGVREEERGWRLGALTTWSDLLAAPLPRVLRGLTLVAKEVGGVQTQNAGTVAGNLCNASPAADGVPALLALDAEVELASVRGTRTLPLEQFILDSRRTARAPDELLTAVLVPRRSSGARSTFRKLGARRYLVISIVSAAVMLEVADDGTVSAAGVAVGACAPVARRLPALEARALGKPRSEALAQLPRVADLQPLRPIDDVRGTAAFRLDAALTLVRRALREVGRE